MRVVFATDRIGPLSSWRAGEALATGWHLRRPQDELVVVPVGAAGAGLLEAYADLAGTDVGLATGASARGDGSLLVGVVESDTCLVGVEGQPPDGPSGISTSAAWGDAIVRGLRALADDERMHPGEGCLVVDLGGCTARDAGAGLLAALGAEGDVALDLGAEGLVGIGAIDLSAPRALVSAVGQLVAVVPADQVDRALVGMRGITSLHGVALREAGLAWDPAALLAADATLQSLATLVAPALVDRPGMGACGGAAFALAALGARLVTGPQWLAARSGLATTVAAADLVVTGSTAYDFAHRGGEAVDSVVALAGGAMRPVVAVAGVVTISAREMRTHGLEAAYALHEAVPGQTVPVRAEELSGMGERLARTWGA